VGIIGLISLMPMKSRKKGGFWGKFVLKKGHAEVMRRACEDY